MCYNEARKQLKLLASPSSRWACNDRRTAAPRRRRRRRGVAAVTIGVVGVQLC